MMKITFHGHACFTVESAGCQLMIDPFLTGNPLADCPAEACSPQLILLTHGHNDHLGDALAIARQSGAMLAGQVDLLHALDTEGIETTAFNTGGSFRFGPFRITMTAAWHGSTVSTEDGYKYGGVAAGFVISDGTASFYHAGDTALFGDMSTVIKRYKLTAAAIPIGDFYTMGPTDAVTAANWLSAKYIIPMHYNTFPVIEQDVAAFAAAVDDKTDSRCLALQPGESVEI